MREVEVSIPTMLPWQADVYKTKERYNVLRVGRRAGKTALCELLAADYALKGKYVGWFSPSYKLLSEIFNELRDILSPVIESSSKIEGVIRLKNGGRIDFWSIGTDESVARGRKYHRVIIDEMASCGPYTEAIYRRAIRPTLMDYAGDVWVASTPAGMDNFFHDICTQKELGFREFHAPTAINPLIEESEIEELRRTNLPLVFQQEVLAEFVSFDGEAIIPLSSMLDENQLPYELPKHFEVVFAAIDTGLKGTERHDSTGVVYAGLVNDTMYLLDYDKVAITGDLMIDWLPSVVARLEEFAKATPTVYGVGTIYIEDAAAGVTLLQAAKRRLWNVQAIPTKLSMKSKDERVLLASSYFFQRKVHITKYCHDKVMSWQGRTKNHLISELCGYRLADKDAYKRADDCNDAAVYCTLMGLGNWEGS